MCPHVGPSGGTARAQLHCLGKRKEVEFLTSCSYQRVVFVLFFFSEQQLPPETTSNEHGCWIAPSQLKRRHCFAHHALWMHPSCSPTPSLRPFITLKMPLTGPAHLQEVEERLICLCTEAKRGCGSKNEQKKRKRRR